MPLFPENGFTLINAVRC